MIMRRLKMAVCLTVLMVATGSGAAWSQAVFDTAAEADSIVAHVRSALDSLETLQCSIEQLYYRDVDEWTSVIRGTLKLKEPSRVRYEDANRLIIADGVTTWFYIPANEQVQIGDQYGDENIPSPKSIFQKYTEGRTAELAGSENIDGRMQDILILHAMKPDESDVKVWIDRQLACPVMTFEEYPEGDTVQYIIRDLRINQPLEDSNFVFEAPPGTDIIDLRE